MSAKSEWALLIDRYVAGECSVAETSAVHAWLSSDPDHRALVDTLVQQRQAALTDATIPDRQLNGAFSEVARRIAHEPPERSLWGSLGWWVPAIAAALVLLIMGSHRLSSHSGDAHEYATAVGERTTFRLDDGTQVTLAPESHLQVLSDERTVQLDGEAYFAVVHDDQHPFAVLSHRVKITDIGTEFDVRGYDDDIRVAVARGSVVVGAGRGNGAPEYVGHEMNSGTVSRTRPPASPNDPTSFQSILSSPPNTPTSLPNTPTISQEIPLSAGDMAEVINGTPTVTHHANVAAETAWRQGQLVFENTPLREVARELSRWYGVEVQIADSSIANRPLTATFTTQSVTDVLEVIARAVVVHVEMTGRKVTIRAGSAVMVAPETPPVLNRLVQSKP